MCAININIFSVLEIIAGKDYVSKGTFAECLRELFIRDGNKH